MKKILFLIVLLLTSFSAISSILASILISMVSIQLGLGVVASSTGGTGSLSGVCGYVGNVGNVGGGC